MSERFHTILVLLGLRPVRKDSVRSSAVLENLRIHPTDRGETQ